MEYSVYSAVNVVLSKPSVGRLPRITISFFFLSICNDEHHKISFLSIRPQNYLIENINIHHLFMCKCDSHQVLLVI